MSNPIHLPPHLPPLPVPAAGRQHLRAVQPGEMPPAPDFLPPGATWLPVPGHVLPAVPGGAPMVGYLVLVPADRTGERLPDAGALPGGGPLSDAGPLAAPEPPPGGPVRVDAERRTATVAGRPLDLTYLEFELLAHLVAHPYRVHSREQLVATVWGYDHVGDGRTVDVHVARLRGKLGPEHRGAIVTVRRIGYKYVPQSAR